MNGSPAESVTEKVQSYAPGTRHRRNPIQQAADLTIKAMLAQGTSIRKVAAALNISPTTVSRVKARMCTNAPDAEDLKSGLMSPRLGEMSAAVVEHFLKKGAKLKTIKGSDAMAAVKTVADRQWPVRQEHGPATFNFANVNLNLFLPDSAPAALGAPVDTTCSVLEDGKTQEANNLNEFNTSNVRL
jgi:transposase